MGKFKRYRVHVLIFAVVGLFVAIAVPNFLSIGDHVVQPSVKGNMHALQVALKDFAELHGGNYPVAADSAAVRALCPGGDWLANPYTGAPAAVVWNADPANPGEIAINPASVTGYVIKGCGHDGRVLPLVVTEQMD